MRTRITPSLIGGLALAIVTAPPPKHFGCSRKLHDQPIDRTGHLREL